MPAGCVLQMPVPECHPDAPENSLCNNDVQELWTVNAVIESLSLFMISTLKKKTVVYPLE